jgi:hypothetical protein
MPSSPSPITASRRPGHANASGIGEGYTGIIWYSRYQRVCAPVLRFQQPVVKQTGADSIAFARCHAHRMQRHWLPRATSTCPSVFTVRTEVTRTSADAIR